MGGGGRTGQRHGRHGDQHRGDDPADGHGIDLPRSGTDADGQQFDATPSQPLKFLDQLRHEPDIFLSPVSLWEIAIKQSAGKLGGPPDLAERVRDMGFRELPVTHAHAIAARRLPPHHRDPFDRMLVAQALAENLTLATRDASIALYAVDVLKG
ncbi:type II toxin-antitoxin system VapC family toxin [Micromonospora sp. BQ11]|uniref:type II toxin-antitoxin system VapC family toxin n=1 Tax=Micromonospora sp. BQ11 TaxID=3452212 RepID=UPI003F8BB3E7